MGNLTHTVGGGVASFKSAARAPIESLKCYFEPVQSGSGDPSPDNIRPITGWDGVTGYKAQKNIGHIIGFSAAANTVQNRVYTNNYGTTIDTINFNGPNGAVVITQSQAPESSSIAHYRNGYIDFYPDNLVFNQKYNISFKVSNIIANPLNTTINSFRIITPSGIQHYPTRIQDNILYYDNFIYKKIENRPEITCIDIRICGMSCTISDFMITPASIENDGIWEPYTQTKLVNWNQWFKPLTVENWQPYSTSNISVEFENGIATSTWLTNGAGYGCSIRTKVGILQNNKEKWYLSYMVKSSMAGGTWGAEYNGGLQQSSIVNEEADTWYQCSLSDLYWRGTRNYAYISYYRSGIAEHTGMVAQIKAPIFVNLTQMFGAGNEPTKEEFEAQCALNGIDLTKELPYDEGSTIEWKTNGDLLKQEITFPVLGKNKFNINSTYAEPSNTAYSGDTERFFQPYTYCVGLQNGNNYSPERITEYSISNNTLTFTSRNTSFGVAFFIPLLYGTYRLSYTGENVNATIIRYDENGKLTYNGSTMDAQGIFAVSKETNTLGIIFRATTADTPATVSNIQLEEGVTVTEYEEFNPNHTIYGGYVDFAKGELVAEWAEADLGTFNYSVSSSQYGSFSIYNTNFDIFTTRTAPGNMYIDKISVIDTNSFNANVGVSGYYASSGSKYRIYIMSPNFSGMTEQEVKEVLSGYKMVYKLTNPIHYSLTPSQLTTFLNYNNFWSNTNGQTEVSYALHDAAPIRAAKHRIAANEPHIETISDSITTFNTSLVAPLKSLRVDFSPIQEGSGDPSPENVRPISGWTGITTYKAGKNLFNINTMLNRPGVTIEGNTFTGNARDIRCYDNVTGKGRFTELFIPAGTTFTVSCDAYTDANYSTIGAGFAILFIYKDNSNVRPWYTRNEYTTSRQYSGIITASQDIIGYYFNWYNYPDNIWHVSNFQIEIGSVATAYESFADSAYPISWQSEAGEVYGGYVDLVSGELVATWAAGKAKIADYSSKSYSNSTGDYCYSYLDFIPTGVKNNSRQKCNMTSYSWNMNTGSPHFFMYEVSSTHTTRLLLFLQDESYEDLEVIVCGELITPIIYQLTPQQIKTLRGVNNIWSDAGTTTVKYWTH